MPLSWNFGPYLGYLETSVLAKRQRDFADSWQAQLQNFETRAFQRLRIQKSAETEFSGTMNITPEIHQILIIIII